MMAMLQIGYRILFYLGFAWDLLVCIMVLISAPKLFPNCLYRQLARFLSESIFASLGDECKCHLALTLMHALVMPQGWKEAMAHTCL